MAFPLPRRAEARIDLSPLIDVVFQLLIFFVVTTTFLADTGIPLELPEAGTGQQETMRPEMSVRIAADGSLRFQGAMVSLADLEARLRQARAAAPEEALIIYGDGRVDLETIVKVMDLARRVQIPGLVLATQEPVVPPTP
jgi:biopolymer transport protein ExbD